MKNLFKSGNFYHVFNKSIAGFGIFRTSENKDKFLQTLGYYNSKNKKTSLSVYLRKNNSYLPNLIIPIKNGYMKFLSFCIMPDHYHLLIKLLNDNIFSKYINDIENSYTRYFNIKHNRKGPLWQSNFKTVRIENNDQLLHVSRYIHLNPTSKKLVAYPENWHHSSYYDFVENEKVLSEYVPEFSIRTPLMYKKFIEDQKDYQARLSFIKKFLLE